MSAGASLRRTKSAAFRTVQRVLRTRGWQLAPVGTPRDDDGYLSRTHDEGAGVPPESVGALRPDHPRLTELRRRYAALDWPVVVHSRWNEAVTRDWLDLRWFRGDYAYVWHYREAARVSELKYLLWLDHVAARDRRDLLDLLDEDGAFGCWTFAFPDRPVVSRDLLDSVCELDFLDRHLGLVDGDGLRVLDIGAGYGRLAHRAAVAAPGLGSWTCVDAVAESTFLCEHYTEFRGVRPPVAVVALDEVPDLAPGTVDLAVNVHSFSECTLAAIGWWVEQLVRLEVPRLFLVPNEATGFTSTEVDGTECDAWPLLREAGFEPVAEAPAIADPAVRALLDVHDRHLLLERR